MDTLEDEHYQVDEAADGKEALQCIEENEYDLLILDYMMPMMTGLEVIEKVRETDKRIKILMLSAKSQQSEQEKVMEAGADFFMAKPFSPVQLLEKVKEILDGA